MSNEQLASSMIEAEVRDELSNAKTLEDKFNISFKAAHNHWMFVDEDEQFKGAIGAVCLHATEEEKTRIMAELDSLRTLNAMLSGVSIDFSNVPDLENPIGITKMWKLTND